MDSSKLVEQALRALQAAPDFNNQTTQMDWGNALAHLMQNQNQNLENQNHQNHQNQLQNNPTQTNSLPSNSNADSSSSPAPSNTPPDVSLQSNVSLKLENNQLPDNALSSLYNSLLTTPETSTQISSANNGMLPSFAELSPNIGSANRNKLAKRDPVNLADNERLALVNKRASDRKAAQKYRRKKKVEMDVLVSENSHLKDRNKELENQLEQATTAIRMLGEQINTHGIGNQNAPCQNCNTYEQQIKELLTRNAELEKSIKGQNVLEELLSQYAKSQTQNLQNANAEWKNSESSFQS